MTGPVVPVAAIEALAADRETMNCQCGLDAHDEDGDGCDLMLISPADLRALVAEHQTETAHTCDRDGDLDRSLCAVCGDAREAPMGDVHKLGRIIWNTSRADEGTISYIGANHIAEAILASGWPR